MLREWKCGDGTLNRPSGIAIGRGGTVYITDTTNHCIQCFDLEGKAMFQWGEKGSRGGEFASPTGITVEEDGIDDQIMAAVWSIPELIFWPPGIVPLCLSYLPEQHVYVSDTLNHRIQVFTYQGNYIRQWGRYGCCIGQFRHPMGCHISRGVLFVCDTINQRLQLFTRRGEPLQQINMDIRPTHVAVSENETAYLTDSIGGHAIKVDIINGNVKRLYTNQHEAHYYVSHHGKVIGLHLDRDSIRVGNWLTLSNRRSSGTILSPQCSVAMITNKDRPIMYMSPPCSVATTMDKDRLTMYICDQEKSKVYTLALPMSTFPSGECIRIYKRSWKCPPLLIVLSIIIALLSFIRCFI